MSTSNPTPTPEGPAETTRWASGLGPSAGLPAGVPSPAELTRLANEIFNALPQDAAVSGSENGRNGFAAELRLLGKSLRSRSRSNSTRGSGDFLAGLTESTPGVFTTASRQKCQPGQKRRSGPALQCSVCTAPKAVPGGGACDPSAGACFCISC